MQTRSQGKSSNAAMGASSSIMAGLLQRQCSCGEHTAGGGQCEECRKNEEGTLQRAGNGGRRPGHVPAIVNEALRSPGHPLDRSTRGLMEGRFGSDFSQVRVHHDGLSARSAGAVSALAYTVGHHIVFGEGQYEPHSSRGRSLLAHELTHVIQQRPANAPDAPARQIAASGTDLEREADRAAQGVASGRSAEVSSVAGGPALQRAEDPKADSAGEQTKKTEEAKKDGAKPEEKPSCGPVDLFTELAMPLFIPNSYFRGSTWKKKDEWSEELGAASQGKCVAKGSFPDVNIAWDLGNPKLGSIFGKNLNKNDLTFDINTIAIYDGKPCCTCFTGNASWSLDITIVNGKETGKTKSPITGSKSGDACKGQQCCTISENLQVGTTSTNGDMSATVTGSVQLNGSTFGENSAEKDKKEQDGAKKKSGIGVGEAIGIALGAAAGAAGLAVGGYFLGKALSKK